MKTAKFARALPMFEIHDVPRYLVRVQASVEETLSETRCHPHENDQPRKGDHEPKRCKYFSRTPTVLTF